MPTTKDKFTFTSTVRTGLTTWSKEKRYFTVWVIEHEGGFFCEFDEDVKKQDV